MPEVVSIHRVPEKHGSAEPLPAAPFLAGLGMDGDWRTRPGSLRQITIIEEEAVLAVSKEIGKAIPLGATRRQVMVRGIRLSPTIGYRLRLGPLLLKVEAPCHPCDRMEINVGPGAKVAMKIDCGVCCTIIEGGELKIGDPVSVPFEDRCLLAGLLLLEREKDYAPEDPFPLRILPAKVALAHVEGKPLEAIGFESEEAAGIWLTKIEAECRIKNEKSRVKLTSSLIGPVKRACTEAGFEAPIDLVKRLIEKRFPPDG